MTYFDLMMNFDFFWPNNLGFPRSMSVKFGLWTFHKLWNKQKNFEFIDFWLPYLWQMKHSIKANVIKETKFSLLFVKKHLSIFPFFDSFKQPLLATVA